MDSCDMLIYMSRSGNVNMRTQPKCWHFNWGTHIFACHTSPSCIICFVASLTKIGLNSIKNLHFTGTERYGNYVTSRVWSHTHHSTSTNEHVPDLFTFNVAMWHNPPMSHCDIELCQCKQSRPVKYILYIIANSTWLNLDQLRRTILVSDVTVVNGTCRMSCQMVNRRHSWRRTETFMSSPVCSNSTCVNCRNLSSPMHSIPILSPAWVSLASTLNASERNLLWLTHQSRNWIDI